MLIMPTLVSIQVGRPQSYGVAGAIDFFEKPWTTGLFKQPISGAVWVGTENISGDGQADLKHHGGPEKAVLAYPVENYEYLEKILDVSSLSWGALGENLSVSGQNESSVCIGDIYQIGTAELQVSQPRQPCWKIARRWQRRDLALLIQKSGKTGWYFRVVREGVITPQDSIKLLSRPYPTFTIAYLNQAMHHEPKNRGKACELAACPLLSPNWRENFARRSQTGVNPNPNFRLWGDSTFQEPKKDTDSNPTLSR